MGNSETAEQIALREFLKLLADLQSKGKITGQQFRENRELWLHQQPNDRDVLVYRLKQLQTAETKTSAEPPRSLTPKKRRL